jgi:hypothetical protein
MNGCRALLLLQQSYYICHRTSLISDLTDGSTPEGTSVVQKSSSTEPRLKGVFWRRYRLAVNMIYLGLMFLCHVSGWIVENPPSSQRCALPEQQIIKLKLGSEKQQFARYSQHLLVECCERPVWYNYVVRRSWQTCSCGSCMSTLTAIPRYVSCTRLGKFSPLAPPLDVLCMLLCSSH